MLAFYVLILIVVIAAAFMHQHLKIKLHKILYMFSIGGFVTFAISLVLYLLVPLFDVIFSEFHVVFFTGNSWIFNKDDLIIQMFPFAFFYDYFYTIVLRSSIIGASMSFLGLLQYLLLKVYHKK